MQEPTRLDPRLGEIEPEIRRIVDFIVKGTAATRSFRA
jgi:hypothetical protein